MSEHDGNANGAGSDDALTPRPGRPAIELSDLERQRLTGLASMGLNQDLAASRLGFSGRTLRRIFDRDEEAALSWTLGRAEAAEEALELLWKQARNGNPAAAIFLGKTVAGLRETGDFEGNGHGPSVNVQILQLPAAAGDMDQWKATYDVPARNGHDHDDEEGEL